MVEERLGAVGAGLKPARTASEPPPEGLGYAVYRVRKRGVTTLQVRERLAGMLRVPQSAIAFPALKDKDAVAVQYASAKGRGPARLEGAGFTAELVGRIGRPLAPSDLAGWATRAMARATPLAALHPAWDSGPPRVWVREAIATWSATLLLASLALRARTAWAVRVTRDPEREAA